MEVITYETAGKRLTLQLHGEIDMATAPAIGAAVDRALAAWRPDVVILDLADVSFIDSSGISLLVDAARNSRSAGYELRLSHVPARVQHLLALTRLTGLFTVETTEPPDPA